jgi:hypothetical protein
MVARSRRRLEEGLRSVCEVQQVMYFHPPTLTKNALSFFIDTLLFPSLLHSQTIVIAIAMAITTTHHTTQLSLSTRFLSLSLHFSETYARIHFPNTSTGHQTTSTLTSASSPNPRRKTFAVCLPLSDVSSRFMAYT